MKTWLNQKTNEVNDQLPEWILLVFTQVVGIPVPAVFVKTDRGIGQIREWCDRHEWIYSPFRYSPYVLGLLALAWVLAGPMAAYLFGTWNPIAPDHLFNAQWGHQPLSELLPTVSITGEETAAIAGLIPAAIIHEVCHLVASFRNGVRPKAWGIALLLGAIPGGAGVQYEEGEFDDPPIRSNIEVASAGVLGNVLLSLSLAPFVLALYATGYDGLIFYFLFGGAVGSLVLAMMNAFPNQSTDGGRVLADLIWYRDGLVEPTDEYIDDVWRKVSRVGTIQFIVLLAAFVAGALGAV